MQEVAPDETPRAHYHLHERHPEGGGEQNGGEKGELRIDGLQWSKIAHQGKNNSSSDVRAGSSPR